MYQIILLHFIAILAMEATPSSASSQLMFAYDPDTQVQVLLNTTALTVPILDQKNQLAGFLDGQKKSGVIFDFVHNKGVYLRPGELSKAMPTQDFRAFILSTPSLRPIYDYGKTHSFMFESTRYYADISKELSEILVTQTPDFGSNCEAMASSAFLTKLAGDMVDGPLNDMEQVNGKVQVVLKGDFNYLVGRMFGMGALFGRVGGGKVLAEKGIKYDYGVALNQPSGVYVFVFFLGLLKPQFDVATIYKNELGRPIDFFTMMSALGGDLTYGCDGLMGVFSQIYQLMADENSIPTVTATVVEYCNDRRTDTDDVKNLWNSHIAYFANAMKDFGLTEASKDLLKVLLDKDDRVAKYALNLKAPCNAAQVQNMLKKFTGKT